VSQFNLQEIGRCHEATIFQQQGSRRLEVTVRRNSVSGNYLRLQSQTRTHALDIEGEQSGGSNRGRGLMKAS